MNNQASHTTSAWPQAPTAGAALLELLTRNLQAAGIRAESMRSEDSGLHIEHGTASIRAEHGTAQSREEAA